MIDRNHALESYFTNLAVQAANLPNDGGLRAYADSRTAPGGLREGMDWLFEAAQEIGDAANYLVWEAIKAYPGLLAGAPDSADRYDRAMRALACMVEGWRQLQTSSS